VVKTANGLSVVPTAVRTVAGAVAPDQSPLESLISFPLAQRDVMQTMDLICQRVSAVSGKKVTLGIVPKDFSRQVLQLEANNQSARDLLAKVFSGRKWADSRNIAHLRKLSWALLYGPDVQFYALNIHTVMAKTTTPNGNLFLRLLTSKITSRTLAIRTSLAHIRVVPFYVLPGVMEPQPRDKSEENTLS
jgi:hypothetical protein